VRTPDASAGLSASSIRQTHRVFALLLGLAVRDGRLARNPAAGVALPRTVRAEQVYLTHGQVDRLASAAGEYRVAVLFLAYTGVRFGEMAALRVRNLDLLRRRDARTQVGDDDARSVRPPVRRSTRRGGRRDERRARPRSRSCGLFAD